VRELKAKAVVDILSDTQAEVKAKKLGATEREAERVSDTLGDVEADTGRRAG